VHVSAMAAMCVSARELESAALCCDGSPRAIAHLFAKLSRNSLKFPCKIKQATAGRAIYYIPNKCSSAEGECERETGGINHFPFKMIKIPSHFSTSITLLFFEAHLGRGSHLALASRRAGY
jgi:hypothetical protein